MTEKQQNSLPGAESGITGDSTPVLGERAPWEKPEVRALHASLAEFTSGSGADDLSFS
jgi:hypothetical protein